MKRSGFPKCQGEWLSLLWSSFSRQTAVFDEFPPKTCRLIYRQFWSHSNATYKANEIFFPPGCDSNTSWSCATHSGRNRRNIALDEFFAPPSTLAVGQDGQYRQQQNHHHGHPSTNSFFFVLLLLVSWKFVSLQLWMTMAIDKERTRLCAMLCVTAIDTLANTPLLFSLSSQPLPTHLESQSRRDWQVKTVCVLPLSHQSINQSINQVNQSGDTFVINCSAILQSRPSLFLLIPLPHVLAFVFCWLCPLEQANIKAGQSAHNSFDPPFHSDYNDDTFCSSSENQLPHFLSTTAPFFGTHFSSPLSYTRPQKSSLFSLKMRFMLLSALLLITITMAHCTMDQEWEEFKVNISSIDLYVVWTFFLITSGPVQSQIRRVWRGNAQDNLRPKLGKGAEAQWRVWKESSHLRHRNRWLFRQSEYFDWSINFLKLITSNGFFSSQTDDEKQQLRGPLLVPKPWSIWPSMTWFIPKYFLSSSKNKLEAFRTLFTQFSASCSSISRSKSIDQSAGLLHKLISNVATLDYGNTKVFTHFRPKTINAHFTNSALLNFCLHLGFVMDALLERWVDLFVEILWSVFWMSQPVLFQTILFASKRTGGRVAHTRDCCVTLNGFLRTGRSSLHGRS